MCTPLWTVSVSIVLFCNMPMRSQLHYISVVQLLSFTLYMFFKYHNISSPFTCWWPSKVSHLDVIKWKPFPRYWPFELRIHVSPVNSPHKGRWRGALIFSLAWTNGLVHKRYAGDLRRNRTDYGVTEICLNVYGLHILDCVYLHAPVGSVKRFQGCLVWWMSF